VLFNSYDFIFLFLPLTLLTLYVARRCASRTIAVWTVGVSSLVFYGAWQTSLVPLLLASVGGNYLIGTKIIAASTDRAKRNWVALGVAANLAVIGYFKYTGFFLGNLNALAGTQIPIPEIILPIGISFFTFTQIAFLVDARRGHFTRSYPFADYLLFVTFFPHLVAGPILIHKFVIPQFEAKGFGRPTIRVTYAGAVLFCIGLFKKVMVADSLAPHVNLLYATAATLSTAEAWLAALLYTLQLYFDFSGYSDMALGLAYLINVRIPNNFNSPYRAASMTEFWRRWHISLSRFLRDYLYIPLGGNRRGAVRQMGNLLITMLLAGLWHGAGWTFIVWGGVHGLMLAINHTWRRLGINMPRALAWIVTFLPVMFAWVIFRATTLHDAGTIFGAMAGMHSAAVTYPLGAGVKRLTIAGVALLAWCVLTPPARWYAIRKNPSVLMACMFAVMLLISVINIAKPTTFLYFQF
jgi:alginate O-acetyltransferase complex protein AlgI